jgi:hypothetical protein
MPFTLHSPNGTDFSLFDLVDSGADFSCFPIPWAAEIGVDLGQCEEVRSATAGGTVTHYRWRAGLEATVGGKRITLEAFFAPLGICLLGRSDFFEVFMVAFNQRSLTFSLTPYEQRMRSATVIGDDLQLRTRRRIERPTYSSTRSEASAGPPSPAATNESGRPGSPEGRWSSTASRTTSAIGIPRRRASRRRRASMSSGNVTVVRFMR